MEEQIKDYEDLEERFVVLNDEKKIVQSNRIIERKIKLSITATLLLYTITAMIQKDDVDFKRYRINVSDFAEYWGINKGNAYGAMEEAIVELSEKGPTRSTLNAETGEIEEMEGFSGFISYYKYVKKEGYAVVSFDPFLKEHYLGIKKNYTILISGYLRQLRLAGALDSTMRTYELLKQYESLGKRRMTVLEYKEFLGLVKRDRNGKVTEEKYKGNNADLKKWALEPAKEKINGNTDITMDYEIIGRGSKAEIKFTIKVSKPNVIQTETNRKKQSQEQSFPENKLREVFGIGSRALIKKEIETFTRWYVEWGFSDEIVMLAYEKTVEQISKYDRNYMNKILENWHKKGYTSIEEIEANASKDKPKEISDSFDADEFIEAALSRSFDD